MPTTKEKETLLAGCLTAIVWLVIVALFIIYGVVSIGFVGMTMWGWYVVPLGFPPLSILWAYGLALIFTLFTYRPKVTKNEDDVTDNGKAFAALIMPWLILNAGWINLRVMEKYFPSQLPKAVMEEYWEQELKGIPSPVLPEEE